MSYDQIILANSIRQTRFRMNIELEGKAPVSCLRKNPEISHPRKTLISFVLLR